MTPKRRLNPGSVLLTVLTVLAAVIWFFPIYWAILTSIRTDQEAVTAGFDLIPDEPTLQNYIYVLFNSNIARWYLNSTSPRFPSRFWWSSCRPARAMPSRNCAFRGARRCGG